MKRTGGGVTRKAREGRRKDRKMREAGKRRDKERIKTDRRSGYKY